jgi:hypothetical protein
VDLAIINETEKIGKLRSGAARDEIRVQMAHSVVLLVKWPTPGHVHRVRIKVASFLYSQPLFFFFFLKAIDTEFALVSPVFLIPPMSSPF